MKQGYTVYVSDEARMEHERQPKQNKKKKDCPSCEIKPGTFSLTEKVESIELIKEGANNNGK